jgi:hypothetical protein
MPGMFTERENVQRTRKMKLATLERDWTPVAGQEG